MPNIQQKKRALRFGLWAENLVQYFLWCSGYKILAHRLITPVAEIDLLVQHRWISPDQLVVVEVKFRRRMSDTLLALRPQQCLRLRRAALWLQGSAYMKEGMSIRIDYVGLSWDSLPRHVKDVCQYSGFSVHG